MAATARFTVMMEPQAKRHIEEKAAQAGLTASEFARRKLMVGKRPAEKDPEEMEFVKALANALPSLQKNMRAIEKNLSEIRAISLDETTPRAKGARRRGGGRL